MSFLAWVKRGMKCDAALKAGVLLFNVESQSELWALAECAAQVKKKARIALRVNPDVPAETHPYISTGLHQHKFGIPIEEARSLYARHPEVKSMEIAGISVHIGSQITDVKPFAATMERVAELTRALRADGHCDYNTSMRAGDLASLMRITGLPGFAEQVATYAEAMLTPLKGLKVHLLLEPGRSIVGPAGALITRLLYKKTNGKKKFLVVDAAMNDLLRPSLYRAYHEIVPVRARARSGEEPHETVDVVGPICETGDFFARDRDMPHRCRKEICWPCSILELTEWFWPRTTIRGRVRRRYWWMENRSRVIRRRETVADLVRGER